MRGQSFAGHSHFLIAEPGWEGSTLPEQLFESLMIATKAEQAENAGLRAMIESVQAEVRSGIALSQSLERHPRHFPPMVVNGTTELPAIRTIGNCCSTA